MECGFLLSPHNNFWHKYVRYENQFTVVLIISLVIYQKIRFCKSVCFELQYDS